MSTWAADGLVIDLHDGLPEVSADKLTVWEILGSHLETIDVSGIPRLYTLVSSSTLESATLVLNVSPGVDAYDFTFG